MQVSKKEVQRSSACIGYKKSHYKVKAFAATPKASLMGCTLALLSPPQELHPTLRRIPLLCVHWIERVNRSNELNIAQASKVQLVATHRTQLVNVLESRANTGSRPNTPRTATSSQM